jgi:KDO2-lipid IV(A) lauroyltransferase
MSKFKYYLIAGLLRMVSYLPLGAAQFIGKWLGLLAWKLGGRPKKITDINLDICLPELTEEQRRDLSRDSLAHTGMTALEIPLMWEWPVDKCLGLIKETEGLELVDEALATGKGLILLAPHLGNWELAGLFFSSRYKMAALYSPPHIKEFEDYMIRVRGRLGSELVRGDRKGLMRLMGILKEHSSRPVSPGQNQRLRALFWHGRDDHDPGRQVGTENRGQCSGDLRRAPAQRRRLQDSGHSGGAWHWCR